MGGDVAGHRDRCQARRGAGEPEVGARAGGQAGHALDAGPAERADDPGDADAADDVAVAVPDVAVGAQKQVTGGGRTGVADEGDDPGGGDPADATGSVGREPDVAVAAQREVPDLGQVVVREPGHDAGGGHAADGSGVGEPEVAVGAHLDADGLPPPDRERALDPGGGGAHEAARGTHGHGPCGGPEVAVAVEGQRFVEVRGGPQVEAGDGAVRRDLSEPTLLIGEPHVTVGTGGEDDGQGGQAGGEGRDHFGVRIEAPEQRHQPAVGRVEGAEPDVAVRAAGDREGEGHAVGGDRRSRRPTASCGRAARHRTRSRW